MAFKVSNLGYDLSVDGHVKNTPNPGDPGKGRLGFEEWLNDNVVTLHSVDYENSQTKQVVIYE